jgi:hypothetical protein
MKIFGRSSEEHPQPTPEEIRARLDVALTSIFNEDGKRTVLYYLANKFDLTLEQACAEPAKLERALTGLLGEVGWMVVKKAILEQFWERKIPVNEMIVVERASLREAFQFIKGFGPQFSFGIP